ncbi:MAG: DEAD/DEAH box helicase [Lacipirellulaceae bacterium]
MELRDYQIETIDRTLAAWDEHDSVMVVLPTGCGKTEVFCEIARRWDLGRTLIVAPQIELVDQAARKIHQRTGTRPGVEQGGRRSNESNLFYRSPYVCASKQTLCGPSKRYSRLGEVGLVIVDECHLAATKAYAEMLEHFRSRGAKVLGVTATPKRHDQVAMGTLFECCPYEMYVADAVRLGWLVGPRASCAQIKSLDLSQVASNRDDFKESELARAMEEEKVIFEVAEITASESVEDGRVLKTVVYCASVKEAQAVASRLMDAHGLVAEFVCADRELCSDRRRAEVLDQFARPDGVVQVVCNVGILTTGWDFPGLEHVVMARPTKSLALYTQILGRGTRPLPGVVDFAGSTPESRRERIAASAKPTFKVTDLADNSLEHKLVGVIDVLGGRMELPESGKPSEAQRAELAARQAALEAMRQGTAFNVEALLSESRAAELKATEERERRRRAAIASRAEYKRVDVDVLSPDQAGVARKRSSINYPLPFGKYKGRAIADVPTAYLQWASESGVFRHPKTAKLIATELWTRGASAAPTATKATPVTGAAPRPASSRAAAPMAAIGAAGRDSFVEDVNRLLAET